MTSRCRQRARNPRLLKPRASPADVYASALLAIVLVACDPPQAPDWGAVYESADATAGGDIADSSPAGWSAGDAGPGEAATTDSGPDDTGPVDVGSSGAGALDTSPADPSADGSAEADVAAIEPNAGDADQTDAGTQQPDADAPGPDVPPVDDDTLPAGPEDTGDAGGGEPDYEIGDCESKGNCLCAEGDADCMCPGVGDQCPTGFFCEEDAFCVRYGTGGDNDQEVWVPGGRPFWTGCLEDPELGIECAGEPEANYWDADGAAIPAGGFAMDRFEVTAEVYMDACADCPTTPSTAGPLPALYLSFDAATNYCGKSSRYVCSGAQWELAARGHCATGSSQLECKQETRQYPWGDEAPACWMAQWAGDEEQCGAPLVAPPAKYNDISAYGAYDMAGNAAEWVSKTVGTGEPNQRVRGAAWTEMDPDGLLAHRFEESDGTASSDVGFRCCRDI